MNYLWDYDKEELKKSENGSIFISERKINYGPDRREWGKKHNFTFQGRFAEAVYILNLIFKNGSILKVDFGFYPYKRFRSGVNMENIEIDSLLDISVNKLLTMYKRCGIKDFINLYFLFQKFIVWELTEGVRVKFGFEKDIFSCL